MFPILKFPRYNTTLSDKITELIKTFYKLGVQDSDLNYLLLFTLYLVIRRVAQLFVEMNSYFAFSRFALH